MLPEGTRIIPLKAYADSRGWFMELLRDEWNLPSKPVQLNAGFSEPGTLRGIHCHPLHNDYLIVLDGEAAIGLKDLRRGSATENLAAVVPLSIARPTGLFIPRGVAHGFFFTRRSVHFYAVDRYFDPADELSCVWNDPGLGIEWPGRPLHLSRKDLEAPSLESLRNSLDPYQPIRA